MVKRMKPEATRNDAVAVMNALIGDTPGWDANVARATEAAEITEEVHALRERHGLTQTASELLGTSQSAIARLENASYTGHSTAVLRRLATAVGERVSVRFVR